MVRTVIAAAGVLALAGNAALAQDVQKYRVFCAASRIAIEGFGLEQMKARYASAVCQFAEFTSMSSAERFAEKNFGGRGKSCTCGS